MPYTIRTLQPIGRSPVPPTERTPMNDRPMLREMARTAVATLDEAREAARKAQCGGYGPDTIRSLIGEAGGTIGPLPDGTVIEVRGASYADLAAAVPELAQVSAVNLVNEWGEAAILAAFNA
jgi:hypothetical protein